MPQAIERLFATPITRPRLPARMLDAVPSAMNPPKPADTLKPPSIAEGGRGVHRCARWSTEGHCPEAAIRGGSNDLLGAALARVVEEHLVGLVRQLDLGRDEEVALAILAGQALAAQAEGAAGAGHRRDRHVHRAGERRHPDRSPKHRFLDLHREPQAEIGALHREALVRQEAGRQQEVARLARAGTAEAAQPDDLTVGDALRDDHVDVAAGRQGDALLCFARDLLERDLERRRDILALGARSAPATAALGGPEALTEQLREDVIGGTAC